MHIMLHIANRLLFYVTLLWVLSRIILTILTHFVSFLQLCIAVNCVWSIYATAEESSFEFAFRVAVNPTRKTCLCTLRDSFFIFSSCCREHVNLTELDEYSFCWNLCEFQLSQRVIAIFMDISIYQTSLFDL